MKPGEYLLETEDILANAGRRTVSVLVRNTGDRPVQVGSHFHFFEVNSALQFDRTRAYGMRLNIAAGTAFPVGTGGGEGSTPFGVARHGVIHRHKRRGKGGHHLTR